MSIHTVLQETLSRVVEQFIPGKGSDARLGFAKQTDHGDLSTTVALQWAKSLQMSPRAFAEQIRTVLLDTPEVKEHVQKVDIAGPGYLNFWLLASSQQQVVRDILDQGSTYGKCAPNTERILVEFVSANPTGPLHVGHARQAVLGDALCNLLIANGASVAREFYYNDAGVQIDTLAQSVIARAQGLGPGDHGWEKHFYQGDYIQDIALAYLSQSDVTVEGGSVTSTGNLHDVAHVKAFAVAYLRAEQQEDLQDLGVRFDHYFLESSVYSNGEVAKVLDLWKSSMKVHRRAGALWLKTKLYGDDKNRVVQKTDGNYTYFVPDVAYHLNKWSRGYTRAVNIQGSDHHGTVARVRGGLQALGLGIPAGYPDYILHTMVRVFKDGLEVKVSKRSGNYVSLRDLLTWSNADAVRFLLLSRKADTEYVFDVDEAVKQDASNPVYYVQYAHARICSILDQRDTFQTVDLEGVDLSPLSTPAALALTGELVKYPKVLQTAAHELAPHHVVFFLRELAGAYHRYYGAEHVLVEDVPTRHARLALMAATRQVLANGLTILGVSAPQRMWKDEA